MRVIPCARCVQVVFGRQPGRTLREYGTETPSLLSRGQYQVRRRLPFLFGGKSSKQPAVFLVSMGYRANDTVLKGPALVGTDNRGVTRVLTLVDGHYDNIVRADFMNTGAGVASRHCIGCVIVVAAAAIVYVVIFLRTVGFDQDRSCFPCACMCLMCRALC